MKLTKKLLGIAAIIAVIGFMSMPLTGCLAEADDGNSVTTTVPVTGETFAITMQNDGNGTAEASPNPAAEEAEVTITATPDSGYSFDSWQVVSGGVTLHSTANPAKFAMPGNAVTIKAIFAEIPPNTPSLSLTPQEFDDVTIGYAVQPAKNVTIKNNGTGTANITSIALDSDENSAFILGNTSITTVDAGGTAVFTVQPKTGLTVGTYEDVITVTYDSGKKAEAEISFTVNNTTTENNTTFNVANADEWNAAVSAISDGGNNETYDINVTGEFSIPGYSSATFGNVTGITVNIRGAGTITLSAGSTGSLLNIGGNQTVSLKETHLKGHSTNNTSLVNVEGGTFNMTGGTISGNNSNGSTGMYSGGSAGGVFVTGGTFNMSGGTISDNTSKGNQPSRGNGGGVGVGNGGTFTMSDTAMISGNKAEGNGGGVYISAYLTSMSSTFTMTGGTITGNTAKSGGGIGNGNVLLTGSGGWNGSTFINITGGIISDNNVDVDGGGIYLYGFENREVTLNMSGTAEIRGNIAGETGGGVMLETGGSFTMLGGIITGNSAIVGGGVEVYNGGTFDLKSFDLVKNNTITNTRGVQVFITNKSTFLINGSPPDPSLNSNDYAWQ